MRVIDNQKRIVLDGTCVSVIPANEPVNQAQMREVWKATPGHRLYAVMAKPQPYERLVMRRGTEDDEDYYVLRRAEHHELTV